MANELRLRGNFTSGTLSGSLTNVATSMSSAGLANLPVVGATQHAVITIENEIVFVTAHTGGATTATILRGQEGTTAAAHNSGMAWVHGPVASDVAGVLGYAQAVANQGSITAGVDLTSLSVGVAVLYAQHRIRITGSTYPSSTVATDRVTMTINEGGTQLQEASIVPSSSAISLERSVIIVPSVASHTYKLTMSRSLGSGTVTNNASGTFPSWILVEDLGPAA